MQNDKGQNVDLYIPRKCSYTSRLISAKDHGSIQVNVSNIDANGVATGEVVKYALAGYIRNRSEGDMALTALSKENDLKALAA
jgi:small subunit ribosomal protein S21e